MSYVIIGDSCTDLTDELKSMPNIFSAPLTLEIEGKNIIDDETFDQLSFIETVKNSKDYPKSACPSPEAFMKHFDKADEVYVVTLSGALSGSYGSAVLARNLYLEDHPEAKIHVFDSCSASVGQTLLVMKIIECKEAGKSFEETVEISEKYRERKQTRFILDTLETFRKNGRINNLAFLVISTLNIKPIMMGTVEGKIDRLDQARGTNKSIKLMAEHIAKEMKEAAASSNPDDHPENRILGISHCNAPERAEFAKNAISSLVHFKDIIVVNMGGVSTTYANDGGIIVAY